MTQDQNALSYWFPKIEAAGLPVPRTTLIEMSKAAFDGLVRRADHNSDEPPGEAHDAFIDSFTRPAIDLGFPVFLRSDFTSGKHDWSRTCFVTDIPAIREAVFGIAYFSLCVGCPCEPGMYWAVRELLPIMPVTWCPEFAGMPVNREFRFFADQDGVKAWQPYWPAKALEQGRAPKNADTSKLWNLSDGELFELTALAAGAARAVGHDEWSIDLLETERGWYLTDMALAASSYRDPDRIMLDGRGA